jgi:hypothetical protein
LDVGYCPWTDLGDRYPGVHVAAHSIAPARAAWLPEERVILLDRELSITEGRCTLAHEIAHMDLGHYPTGVGHFDRRQERDADGLAARRLLALFALVEAVRGGWDLPAVADQLRVTQDVLQVRLDRLHPSERHALRKVIARLEVAA